MKAYYYDDLPGDPRSPHTSPTTIPPTQLAALGLLHQHIPVPSQPESSNPDLDSLADSRGYSHRDQITVSPAAMGAVYEDKIKMFFAEHMHEDEEIRYILEGAGYFDVRNEGGEGEAAGDGKWVRVRLEQGDLLVLPAGIYHRFTTDENNYIKAMRLFKEAPKWTPLNRGPEVDENPYRKEYLQARAQQVAAN